MSEPSTPVKDKGDKKDKKGGLLGLFGKNKTFDRNSSLVETQLKLAFQAETENCARLRKELAEEQAQHEIARKLRDREINRATRLEKENEILKSLLQDGPDGYRKVLAENTKLRDELEASAKKQRQVEKKRARVKAVLKKERETRATEKAESETQLRKLLEEKNKFEKKCAALQLQKLNQNFSEKTASDIETESRDIFHKQLDLLPCHKDLPRLIKSMDVIDMEGNLISKPIPEVSIDENIRLALINIAGRLDGEELAQKIADSYRTYVPEGGSFDLIKALFKLLKEVLGEQAKITAVLKAANQSIIAPVVSFMQTGLESVLPFNAAKNGWKIQILVGEKVIRVTHKRQEQATPDSEELYGQFTFDWTIDFLLDRNGTEMTGMEVRLTGVTCADKKKYSQLKELLEKSFERFQPKKENLIHIAVDT